ncbi:MAG: bifunctional diguanylate cyclase/phosphodiesterase [Rhodocyclaceae bacterium]|nr:bifunctional diguanylate cyclase/phosphodiesterase [Rhodocyclaceae bacterium]
MTRIWKRSILGGTFFAVAMVALVVGSLFVMVTLKITDERATNRANTRLMELMASAEQTAAIACFANDVTLATETARGLTLSSDVLDVAVISGGRELARVFRKGARQPPGNVPLPGRLVAPLYSPFNPSEKIGELRLDPNLESIRATVFEEIRYVALLLVLLAAAMVSAVAAVLGVLVVRPVKTMSDQLHVMDAGAGERLPVPRGHEESELGRLAGDINGLTGKLVAAAMKEHELRLQRELDERKYRAIFDNVEAGIFLVDGEFRLKSFNPAFGRLMRLALAERYREIAGFRLSELPWLDGEGLAALVNGCLADNAARSDDLELDLAEGGRRWFNLVLRPVGEGLAQGMASDVTERRLAEQKARQQLVTDDLTSVANRAGLEAVLRARIEAHASAEHTEFALLLVDLDGFKRVNDALGLPVGDEILRNTARRLQSCLYEEDVVARMGGDEFAVIARAGTGEEGVARVAERIVSVLNFSFLVADAPAQLGASVGVALFPGDGRDVPTLLRNAELALDRARANGGHRCQFFDSSMAQAAQALRRLDTDMHLAVRRHEFRLFLQPIVNLLERRLVGAEALLRWQHKERGMVPPDAFIPVAEETGFIREIGLWVLEAACQQLALWQGEGQEYYLSINISGRQVPDGLTPAMLLDATRRHGIVPERLVLEITEGVLINDMVKAQSWLAEVHEKGFRIYLDDFGTGYSSLSYLKRFPVDTVKVDQSFVRDMSDDSSDRKLVEAVVAMAHSLDMQVVAEGVENATQARLLRDMGCCHAQGYYFSRPVPAQDFAAVAEEITRRFALEQ